MLHALIASLALSTLAPMPTAHSLPVGPRKTIANLANESARHHVVRYFDDELNVACYVIGSGYLKDYQTRIACVRL